MNNTTVRAISGTVFVILMVLCLSFNKFLFAAMVITIMVFMLLEYYRISMGNSYAFSKVLAILSAVFLFVLLFVMQAYHLQLRFVALAMVPVFIVMINSIYLKDKSEYDKLSNICY